MNTSTSVLRILATAAFAFGAAGVAVAQAPRVLVDACNALPQADRRLECLRAAHRDPAGTPAPANVTGKRYGTADAPATYVPPPSQGAEAYPVTPVLPMQPLAGYPQPGYPQPGYPQPGYAQPGDRQPANQAGSQPGYVRQGYPISGGQTCFVGPRGGTYTLTPSGRKNYGGC